MGYSKIDVVFQEVPDEISLGFYCTGCPLNCKNCHSQDFNKMRGTNLTEEYFIELLKQYNGYISCVLFFGGDWHTDLKQYLKIARAHGLNTCLYTGNTELDTDIKPLLTYVKLGPYIETLGPLSSKTTNQRFYDIRTNTNLTYKFWRTK